MKIELADSPCIVPIYGFGTKPENQPGYWAEFGAVPAAERLHYDTLTESVDAAYDKAASANKCNEPSSHWRLASLLVDRAVHPATDDTLASEDFEGAEEALDRVFKICEEVPLNRLTVRATQFRTDLSAYRARRNKEWLAEGEIQGANEKRGELLREVLQLPEGEKMRSMVAQLATRLLLGRHPSGLQILTSGARERAEVGEFEVGTVPDFYGWFYHDHGGNTVFAEKLPMKAYVERRRMRLQRAAAPNSPVRRFALGDHAQHLLARYDRNPATMLVARWLSKEALGEKLDNHARSVLDVLTQRAHGFLVGATLDCCS
ncbi:MAG TPA: hypothetical protein VLG11_01680 [Candidatus Saccharimonadales bacterium]|nr:hypothetical protein [Candidatus Saccharimonadales bacterium]